jgi:hypothetical protein
MDRRATAQQRLQLEAEVERRALLRETDMKRLRVLLALAREQAELEAAAEPKPRV